MHKSFVYAFVGLALLFGDVVRAQVLDDAPARFKAIDSDSDGKLSKEEFKVYVEEKLPEFKQFEKLISRLDSDKNGSLSLDEFRQRRPITKNLINEAAAASAKPVEFAESFNTRYLTRKPLVGDSIENLTAFDELGNELDFKTLRGKYTVFNFGCLT